MKWSRITLMSSFLFLYQNNLLLQQNQFLGFRKVPSRIMQNISFKLIAVAFELYSSSL